MVEVSQIHSSPTPTHHPANPVNSENPKDPTREKKRNPAAVSHAAGRLAAWPCQLELQMSPPPARVLPGFTAAQMVAGSSAPDWVSLGELYLQRPATDSEPTLVNPLASSSGSSRCTFCCSGLHSTVPCRLYCVRSAFTDLCEPPAGRVRFDSLLPGRAAKGKTLLVFVRNFA